MEDKGAEKAVQDLRSGKALSLFLDDIQKALYANVTIGTEDPPAMTTPAALPKTATVTELVSVDNSSSSKILQCIHKEVEKCHYTFKTYFKPSSEELCHENFEKLCQIRMTGKVSRELVRRCTTPFKKLCNGKGPEQCQTFYDTKCFNEKEPTQCVRIPKEVCGKGCEFVEVSEDCYDEENHVLVDVPEETCDLSPWKRCTNVTRLVPSLRPKKECTIVPMEVCNLHITKKE